MANEQKKYASLENLQTFKTNADDLYATKAELEELAENVGDVSITVDTELSSTSNNPVANKVIKDKLDVLEDSLSGKADEAHPHDITDIEMDVLGWNPKAVPLNISALETLISMDDLLYDINEELPNKADSNHNHDSKYDSKGAANTALGTAIEYTDSKIFGLASTSSVNTSISNHNTDNESHNDIRDLITELRNKLNNFLNVDDATTDQLSEVLTLIENNKGTLESLTTSKVNVSDIANNLTTNNASKVLSAAQGVAIKKLIDDTQSDVETLTTEVAYINVTDNETLFTEANIQEALNTAAEEIDTLVGGDA